MDNLSIHLRSSHSIPSWSEHIESRRGDRMLPRTQTGGHMRNQRRSRLSSLNSLNSHIRALRMSQARKSVYCWVVQEGLL
jgi:hypothetical protein